MRDTLPLFLLRANNVLDSGMRCRVILWASERRRLGARRDRLVTFYALGIKSGPPTAYRSPSLPPSLRVSRDISHKRSKDRIHNISECSSMSRRRLEASHEDWITYTPAFQSNLPYYYKICSTPAGPWGARRASNFWTCPPRVRRRTRSRCAASASSRRTRWWPGPTTRRERDQRQPRSSQPRSRTVSQGLRAVEAG